MDQPFPELEIKMCYKILTKMKISHLLNIDKDDVVQEIILSLLEDEAQWQKLRKKEKTTTLIYTALKNKIINLLDKQMTASDIARHSPKEAEQEVYNQLRNEEGNVWDTYCTLPEAEKGFVKEFYNPATTIKRVDIKHKHKITESQAARASRKVLRSARLDLTYRTLVDFNQEDLNV